MTDLSFSSGDGLPCSMQGYICGIGSVSVRCKIGKLLDRLEDICLPRHAVRAAHIRRGTATVAVHYRHCHVKQNGFRKCVDVTEGPNKYCFTHTYDACSGEQKYLQSFGRET